MFPPVAGENPNNTHDLYDTAGPELKKPKDQVPFWVIYAYIAENKVAGDMVEVLSTDEDVSVIFGVADYLANERERVAKHFKPGEVWPPLEN